MIKRFTHTPLLQALFIALLSISLSSLSLANEQSPKVVIEDTLREMIDALNQHETDIKRDPSRVNSLVENILLPRIDIIAASRWVLGKHWRRANKQQKLQFIREFRTLLLRFYSSALADYLQTNTVDHNLFTFLPLRDGERNKDDVTVHSQMHGKDGKSIPVKYSMHRTKKGWKVYDVSVEGISVITTYRTSFATEIKQRGIDGLITMLVEKNAKLAKIQPVALKQ